jgi:hypothetical protein
MSISLDSTTSYIARTANVPANNAFTIGGWWYFDSLPAANKNIYILRGSSAEVAGLRWNSTSVLRVYHAIDANNFSANPTAATWIYIFLRTNGTSVEAGWKTIAESDFLTSGHKVSYAAYTGQSPTSLRVGASIDGIDAIDGNVFRLSVWDAYVSDADLLTAAATDLGYTTSINTHIPGTSTGDPSRYADTSGNSRNWTPSGTISDGSDPTFGGGFIARRTLLGVG